MNWIKWLPTARRKHTTNSESGDAARDIDEITRTALEQRTVLQAPKLAVHPIREQRVGALGSPAVLAHINQQWMTPLSHIRSAIDALSRSESNPSKIQHSRQNCDSLALLQDASYQLRASIENIIDFHEITAGRLTNTPGPLRPCALGEELVSSWQATAQKAGHLLVFAGDQDVPNTVSLDPELTRRLLDRLTCMLLSTQDISEPAIRCHLMEQIKPDTARLSIAFDARPTNPENCLHNAINLLATPLPDELQTLLEEGRIDSWIVQRLAKLLNAAITIGPTRDNPERFGVQIEVTVPVTQACQPEPAMLEGQHVAVITESDVQARAVRAQLVGLGAFITPVDPRQPAPDMIFADSVGWSSLKADPDLAHWHTNPPALIGLQNAITIRGRAQRVLGFADFTLPGFIPRDQLLRALKRIFQTDLNQHRKKRKANKKTEPSHPAQPPKPSTLGRALVVDDDPIYIAHLSNLLGSMGFVVFTAASGREAMACADAKRIDVVLTDMHMPDITGAGVARMLRRHPRYRDTPILAVTANRQSNVHRDLRQAGVQQVLTKPVSTSELQAALTPFFKALSTPAPTCPTPAEDPFLIQLLCEELPGYQRMLKEPEAQLQQLRHAAHKLRGAAGCCQQTELKNAAQTLENAITEQKPQEDIDQARNHLLQVVKQLDKTLCCS